ncbi:MAG: hypothetical protein V4557_09675 [Bacteroidota bacterium]
MNQQIFQCDRYFTIFDCLVSHGQLLLRSQKDDNYRNNIDIIFFDTHYIQLLSELNGLCIRICNDNTISYQAVKKYLTYDNNHLFEIESGLQRYYIAASFVTVFENELDFNQSSLNFENIGREREIATSIIE